MNLPNWAKLVLGLAIVIITWLMNAQASGQLVLPAFALTLLTVLKTALAMLSDGVPTAAAKMRARRVLQSGARAAAALLVLGGIGTAASLGCQGCTPASQQKGVATVQPATDAAVCIIKDVVGCATAKPPTPWLQCTEKTALDCGTDVATVGTIWAAHKLAEAREADAGAIAAVVNYP